MNKQFKLIVPAVSNEIEKGNIAGANISVIKDGKEIYHSEIGYADKENKIPMCKDTIFRMFSMTKPVTAAAAMLLLERGEIDLYDPVSNFLDGFKNQKVAAETGLTCVNREVTIRDILSMTSGIAYPDQSFEAGRQMDKLFLDIKNKLEGGIPTSTIDYCNQIGRVPLAFQPGEAWLYGASADVMAAVIQVVSGMKYSDFLRKEFFDPLQMTDTAFWVQKEKLHRFAQIYEYSNETHKLNPYLDNFLGLNNYKSAPAFESGGAGLVSTIEDYTKFALMLLNKGTYKGVRILGRKTVEFMTENQLNDKQLNTFNWDSVRGYGYGNFMRILMNKSEFGTSGTIGEFGWDGWTGNYINIDPKENLIFMYFIQRCGTGTTDFTRKLRSIVYSALD